MISILSEKNYDAVMAGTVEPALKKLREDISLPLTAGGTLHAEVYEQSTAVRAVVILHGYTESAEKFREMTWYFLRAGFNVYAVDHRGHGQSAREVDDTSITHIGHFDDYLSDLEDFMAQIVLQRTANLPRTLYAHSMGGAIGAFALMRHPEWFERAVLTAPMIAASTFPLPRCAGLAIAEHMVRKGKGSKRAFVGKPFNPDDEKFESACSTSRARFDYYLQKRITQPLLQNCSPSYAWVREALSVTPKLLSPDHCRKIITPLLLCQATHDKVVCLSEQEQFVRQIPCAKLERFDAKHEIYMSGNDVMEKYVPTVISFLMGT